MPFKPGQSGNPKGRPVVDKDIQKIARQHTQQALDALIIALSEPRNRVAAAVAILDRGHGKPGQTIDLNHRVVAAIASDADLAAIAFAGGGFAAPSKSDQDEPGDMVH